MARDRAIRIGLFVGTPETVVVLLSRAQAAALSVVLAQAAYLQRESSSLATYWSESLNRVDDFSGPALRDRSLNSLLQVALHLPF